MQIGVTDIGGGKRAEREKKAIEKDHERMGSQRIYLFIRPLIFFSERRCYFQTRWTHCAAIFFLCAHGSQSSANCDRKKKYTHSSKCADTVRKKRKFAAVGGKKIKNEK